MNAQNETITVEALRRILFNVDNQEMTVAELRRALFEVDDQEAIVDDKFSTLLALGINGR